MTARSGTERASSPVQQALVTSLSMTLVLHVIELAQLLPALAKLHLNSLTNSRCLCEREMVLLLWKLSFVASINTAKIKIVVKHMGHRH